MRTDEVVVINSEEGYLLLNVQIGVTAEMREFRGHGVAGGKCGDGRRKRRQPPNKIRSFRWYVDGEADLFQHVHESGLAFVRPESGAGHPRGNEHIRVELSQRKEMLRGQTANGLVVVADEGDRSCAAFKFRMAQPDDGKRNRAGGQRVHDGWVKLLRQDDSGDFGVGRGKGLAKDR